MKTAEIQRRWLNFFEKKNHVIVPSASLISEDPSLLFTVAGMVPFIPYMTGLIPSPYKRATSVQKCVRTLDIEEVGKTTRHGTFFQMNGNFSFGDYFKREAIEFAWEFLTAQTTDGGLGLDPEKLWVTVFRDDDESIDIWLEVSSIPLERIQKRGMKDNYWSTGQPGPAGPCSEIYFDRGPSYGVEGGPEADEDRYIEIWNLVFMQYERGQGTGKDDFEILRELPSKNIDTGMGLERVAFLMQNVENLYEIDQVRPVLDLAAELSGKVYGSNEEDDVRLRVVADHVRSALMLISDGVSPGNDGRGYVLRRLLRRTVRSMRLLGVDEPIFAKLFETSKNAMVEAYPELDEQFERIQTTVRAEEEAFMRTLVSGTAVLEQAIAQAKSNGDTQLTGDVVFLLHDTYGFPIDLTIEIAGEQNITVKREDFDELMLEQRTRAKADAKLKKSGATDLGVYAEFRNLGQTVFTGYQTLTSEAKVLGIIKDGAPVAEAQAGDVIDLILDQTSFYAESGGQSADLGLILGDAFKLEVLDVQKPVKGLVSHRVQVVSGGLARGNPVRTMVDSNWRLGAAQAHSATHVLHAALRQVLGPNALQSGSFNKPGYLRLDFAWNQALSLETRSEIEEISNLAIRQDLAVSAQQMSLPEAKAWGAVALFGETYDESVRVIEIGGPWSRELCGGTHVSRSSQIGLISVTGESSVGSGSRRIEAEVGIDALSSLNRDRLMLQKIAETLRVSPTGATEKLMVMLNEMKEIQRQLAQYQMEALNLRVPELLAAGKDLNGLFVIADLVASVPNIDALRELAFKLRDQSKESSIVALFAILEDKPSVLVVASQAAQQMGHSAGNLVKLASSILGGGGGGKAAIAQGGGTDSTKIPLAIAELLKSLV